jgi:hypothetical protein
MERQDIYPAAEGKLEDMVLSVLQTNMALSDHIFQELLVTLSGVSFYLNRGMVESTVGRVCKQNPNVVGGRPDTLFCFLTSQTMFLVVTSCSFVEIYCFTGMYCLHL